MQALSGDGGAESDAGNDGTKARRGLDALEPAVRGAFEGMWGRLFAERLVVGHPSPHFSAFSPHISSSSGP